MNDIIFPGPDGDCRLRLTLDLVAALEDTGGSLLQVADKMVKQHLKLADILPLLRIAYRGAGCKLEDAALDEFLLSHAPHILLAELLLGILTPLKTTGATRPGE